MKIVLFCENLYAIDILMPIHKEALLMDSTSVLWYVHAPKISHFPLDDELRYTTSIQDVYDFSPDVIFVPGNIVPYYLPGVKIQIFHGYAAEKKDHWVIRRYFDLYLTQGPFFTRKFTELSQKYKDFSVVETGWSKQDWIQKHRNDFDVEKKKILADHKRGKLVLYAPTFSKSLTSLSHIKTELVNLVHKEDVVVLIKLHPLTKQEWVDEYKQLATQEEHIVWLEDFDVTKAQLMADVMISDTSSTVYEFLLLDKPVITLRTIAKDIYWNNIEDPSLLIDAYQNIDNEEIADKRKWVMQNYDPYTDGQVCRRMLDAAARYIEQHGVPRERKLNIWRKYTSIKTFGRIRK